MTDDPDIPRTTVLRIHDHARQRAAAQPEPTPPTTPPHSWRGTPGVCGPASMKMLEAMPEFQAGQRTVRNQQYVDESRELGRGQRRDFFSMLPALHWWEA